MEIILKQPTLNEYNLSLRDLHDNLDDVIKRRHIKPKIKNLINIYEQSTQAPTNDETETITSEQISEPAINPTTQLIRFLINRNRADTEQLNLTHYRNIRCKDNNNKSCIIPIYKTPDSTEQIKHIEQQQHVLLTLNNIYCFFTRDIYNIKYGDVLNTMETIYKIDAIPTM
jgi:hypothetical protein